MLLFQFKVLIPNKDSYNVTLIKNFYSGKIKIIKSNITTTNFTTNFNKNSNRNLLTAKNYSGGLFNYVYKFNDLYLKANFTSASYANYLTHNQVLNTKIIKEISVNFKYILKTNIINDASYKKLYNFISNYTFLSD